MKRHTSTGQKAAAVVVLALTALSAAYCLGGPSEALEPERPALAETPLSSPTPSVSARRPSLEDLEDHGYYQDPLVNQGPLPNRQAPRRAYRKAEEERQYSRKAADEVVATILGSIITPDMDASEQCSAVYYYIKGCITCDGTSVKSDWRQAAYWGFTTGKGDEYTFYACSRALLSALGFQVREVKREGGDLTEPHSWSLVNYNGGWYHFDPCPHLKTDPLFVCCLSTDQQLMNFDAGAERGYYAFDADAYPERVGGPASSANTVPMPKRDADGEGLPVPTPAPTPSPSATPEPSPSPTPEVSAAPEASVAPSAQPSASPSPAATPATAPSAAPSPTPSVTPSVTPSTAPSAPAVPEPTVQPTPEPTPEPTPPPAIPLPTPDPEEPLLPPDV